MALINDIYVHITDESLSEDVEVSSHPVESGIEFTDTVKRGAAVLSISGMIVDYWDGKQNVTASTVISKLKSLKNTGGLVRYIGRNWLDKMQIASFETSHPNTVWGGAEFSMTLKECRIVHNAYVAPKIDESNIQNGGQQQVEKGESKEVWYTVKKGDCVAALVAEPKAPYKSLKREGAKSGYWGACNWVMDKNPTAFSRKGDFRTLQIGKKILLGVKE